MSMMRELLMARQQKKEIWLQSSTSDSDAAFIGVLYNNGLCKSPDVIYLDEAASITTMPSLDSIKDVYEGGDWSPLVNCSTFEGNFTEFSELTYIKFPSNFASNIKDADNFFGNSQKLKNIVFGNNSFCNVTNASRMFHHLTALEAIDMPDNFISKVATNTSRYNVGMFASCESIESLAIPDNFAVSSKGFNFFTFGCKRLKKLTFGKNFLKEALTIMRFDGYAGTNNLCEEYIFPEGSGQKLTTLVDSIYSNNLKKLVLPDGFGRLAELGSTGNYAFLAYTTGLEEVYLGEGFGESAKSISGAYGRSLLYNAPKLHTLVGLNLPNVTSNNGSQIGGAALTNVTMVKSPKCSFSFSASPLLSEDSLRSIITSLNNEPLEGATLKLHATAKARLQAMSDYDTLLSSATAKGWMIA